MIKPVYMRQRSIGKGVPKICIPLTGRTKEEILVQAGKAAAAGADLLEWRADLWEEERPQERLEEMLFSLASAVPDLPLLFTVRTKEEGGAAVLSAGDYSEWIQIAADSGKADLIDIEYLRDPDRMRELTASLQRKNVLVIASSHDFEKTGTEEELFERLRSLDRSGADILKLAVMPADEEDVQALMRAVKRFTSGEMSRPVIAVSMGKTGEISRVEGELYGSCITFGTAGEASAPGQIPAGELRMRLEEVHRRILTGGGLL